MLSSKSYTASLPQKRMGAGCLFFDAQGKILLVKPTYKPGWEIPGGVVELNESPKECCEREVYEELGLTRKVGSLLVVDYNHETDEKTESLMFIFNGGLLAGSEIAAIQLPQQELSEFRFFAALTFPAEIAPPLRNQILSAYKQITTGQGIYIEDQRTP